MHTGLAVSPSSLALVDTAITISQAPPQLLPACILSPSKLELSVCPTTTAICNHDKASSGVVQEGTKGTDRGGTETYIGMYIVITMKYLWPCCLYR